MRILIIGGTGVLGSTLCKFFELKKIEYYFTSRKKNKLTRSRILNLSSLTNIKKLLIILKPKIIINCTGLTNVDLCNKNYEYAFKENVKSVRNLVNCLCDLDIKTHLVHISSDQVYFNKKNKLNYEKDVNLSNNYSKTKFLGEKEALKYLYTTIIRTNFFGKSYSKKRVSFSEFILNNLLKNNKVSIANNILFSPVGLSYLNKVILKIIKRKVYGVYNIGSKNKITKYEFVLELTRLKGLKEKNLFSFNSTYKKDKRPLNTSVSSKNIIKKLNIMNLNTKDMLIEEHQNE